jgi:outer membrane receptor protein involved in Fe transport
VETGQTSDGRVNWTAHVAFELSRQIDLYASYATGFRASSINLSLGSRPFGFDQAALDAAGLAGANQGYGSRFARPEDTKVYELGMRADWGAANANLAVFQQSLTGSQTNLYSGSGFVLANAGRETVRGIEFEGNIKPARGWLLSAALTYLDARYESFAFSAVGDLRARARPASLRYRPPSARPMNGHCRAETA